MTILQSRTIAIINAGLDYQQALHSLAQYIGQLCKQAEYHHDYAATCNEIRLTCQNFASFLKNNASSHHTLLTERDHFARNYIRNKANAERIRQKRAQSAAELGIIVKKRPPIPPAHAAYHIDPVLISEQDRIPTPILPPNIGIDSPTGSAAAEEMLQARRAAIARKLKYNPALLDALEADPNFQAPELGERWLINEAIHTMRYDPTKDSTSSAPSPFDDSSASANDEEI